MTHEKIVQNQIETEKVKLENEELKRRLKKAQQESDEMALIGMLSGIGRRRALEMYSILHFPYPCREM